MAVKKAKPPKGVSGRVVAAKAAAAARAADLDAEVEDAVISGVAVAEETNVAVSCVKMKLASFCPDARIRRVLCNVVSEFNVVLAEAYAFANFHVARSLEAGLGITDVGPKFYDRCIKCVALCNARSDLVDAGMRESARLFCGLRPPQNTPADISWMGDVKSEIVLSMATMAANHLRTNLQGRIEAYLAWRHAPLTPRLRRAVAESVAVYPKRPLDDFAALQTCRANGVRVMGARLAAIELATSVAASLRRECPLTGPADRLSADKVVRMLPLYHRLLRETEHAVAAARVDADLASPDCKARARALKTRRRLSKARFTMLPLKSGFTASSIPICSRAWVAVLRRLKAPDGRPVVPWKTNQLSPDLFNSSWRRHCDVAKVETRSRAFGGRIATDGVSVTVVMEATQALIRAKPDGACDDKAIEALAQGRHVRYVGVDPGLTDVVTVADESGTATTYSSSRYYERSKIKLSNRRTDAWNQETVASSSRIDKSGDWSTHAAPFYATYLAEVRGLLSHRAARGYRNMRFMRHVFKQKAVSEIVAMIAPRDAFTVVGFGDWSGPGGSPIKRRFCGPLQEIKRELARRPESCLLRSIWECRTSKVCHETWTELVNMVAVSTSYDRTVGAKVAKARGRVHKILHCRNSGGASWRHGGTWNRDVNASRNILMLLKLEVRGAARPAEFMPAQVSARRRAKRSAGASRATNPSVIRGLPEAGGNIQVEQPLAGKVSHSQR